MSSSHSNEMAQQRWHLSRDGNQCGPFSDGQLAKMAENGELGAQDLLWRPGYESWRPASTIPGLLKPPPLPAGNTSATPSQAQPLARSIPGEALTKFEAGGATTRRTQTIEQTDKTAKILTLVGWCLVVAGAVMFFNSGGSAAAILFVTGVVAASGGYIMQWWRNA
jgi:GYF domain 2